MPLHGQGLVQTPPVLASYSLLCLASNPALRVALQLLRGTCTPRPYTAYTTRYAHCLVPGVLGMTAVLRISTSWPRSLVLLSRARPPVHPLYPTHPSLQSLHPSIHPSYQDTPLASATPHMASPQQRAPSAYITLRPTSGLVAPLTFLKRRGDPAAVLLASLTSA
jgi:hypothetical protein